MLFILLLLQGGHCRSGLPWVFLVITSCLAGGMDDDDDDDDEPGVCATRYLASNVRNSALETSLSV